jgi:hypothetical protein
MTQADSVHSTPPTNTSANDPPGGPENPQDSLYLPTDISPEEVFQAIGRLRKEARDEIDRLIRFLDESDNHMAIEDCAVDDDPCDDNELDGSDVDGEGEDDEESEPDEPSLGSGGGVSQTYWAAQGTGARADVDLEDEHDGAEPPEDDEPSLGSFDRMMDQTKSTFIHVANSVWPITDGEVDPALG